MIEGQGRLTPVLFLSPSPIRNDRMADHTLTLQDQDEVLRVFGPRDQYLRPLREALGVRIIPRDSTLQVEGPDFQVEPGRAALIAQLRAIAKQGRSRRVTCN